MRFRRGSAAELSAALRGALGGAVSFFAFSVLAFSLAVSPPPAGVDAASDGQPLTTNRVLELDGRSALRLDDVRGVLAPDGPFTIECWARADRPPEKTAALVGWRYYGGFALLHGHGPHGLDRPVGQLATRRSTSAKRTDYVVLRPLAATSLAEWTHVALTFHRDERERGVVGLFVDGRRVAEAVTSAIPRAANSPLFVGADPRAGGEPENWFRGRVDAVRISRVARYDDDFVPPHRMRPDRDTVVLLDFEDESDPFANRAPMGARFTPVGDARVVVER